MKFGEKLYHLSVTLFPPLIPILCLWGWLSPVSFVEQMLTFIVCAISYVFAVVAWFLLLLWMTE